MPEAKVALLAHSQRIADRIRRDTDRLLTEKANQAFAYAQNLANASLHVNRPASRRNLTFNKPHYVNAFVVHSTINNRNRVRVELTNTSPVAGMIERGTKAHWIVRRTASGRRRLKPTAAMSRGFRFDQPALRFPIPTARRLKTGRQKGVFAVTGPPFAYRPFVRHPGGRSFQILGRTAKAVRSGQVGRGTGIRSG